MSYYRRNDDDDTEISYEDQLRVIACSNPTLVGSEIVTLAGTVPATTTKEELYDVRQNRRRRSPQRAAVSS